MNKAHRPRLPLLVVLIGVAIFVAATSAIAADVDIVTRLLEPVVSSALVASVAITRLFVR